MPRTNQLDYVYLAFPRERVTPRLTTAEARTAVLARAAAEAAGSTPPAVLGYALEPDGECARTKWGLRFYYVDGSQAYWPPHVRA